MSAPSKAVIFTLFFLLSTLCADAQQAVPIKNDTHKLVEKGSGIFIRRTHVTSSICAQGKVLEETLYKTTIKLSGIKLEKAKLDKQGNAPSHAYEGQAKAVIQHEFGSLLFRWEDTNGDSMTEKISFSNVTPISVNRTAYLKLRETTDDSFMFLELDFTDDGPYFKATIDTVLTIVVRGYSDTEVEAHFARFSSFSDGLLVKVTKEGDNWLLYGREDFGEGGLGSAAEGHFNIEF